MPQPKLHELLDPSTKALVRQECQGGVVGPQAILPMLADEARREAIPNITRLLHGARSIGVTVVHCLALHRADGRGYITNARLFAATKAFGADATPGSEAAALLPELGPVPTDIVLTRMARGP